MKTYAKASLRQSPAPAGADAGGVREVGGCVGAYGLEAGEGGGADCGGNGDELAAKVADKSAMQEERKRLGELLTAKG